MQKALSFAALGATAFFSFVASADVQHVIGKGHTIEAIAARYHVSAKSIIEANHLKDVKHLKIGDVLTIPKVDAKKPHDEKGSLTGAHDKDVKKDAKAKAGPNE